MFQFRIFFFSGTRQPILILEELARLATGVASPRAENLSSEIKVTTFKHSKIVNYKVEVLFYMSSKKLNQI